MFILSANSSFYLAGSNTVSFTMSYISRSHSVQTVSALDSFYLAMVLHPHVFRKAQEELDRVVGLDRLPDFSDRHSLPYITAIIKECLRWNPVSPLPVAHRLMVDDIYEGYFMPAGSIVLGNCW
jgi:cytochrome P450